MKTYTVFVDYENDTFDGTVTDDMLRDGGMAFDSVIFKEFSDAEAYANDLCVGNRIVETETNYLPKFFEVHVTYLDTYNNNTVEEQHLVEAYSEEAAIMFVDRSISKTYASDIVFFGMKELPRRTVTIK